MRICLITGLCIILIVLPLSSGQAQESTHPVITAENVSQLMPLRIIGQGFIHDVSWSIDGTQFLIASSIGVWEYDAQNLSASPRLIEIPDIDNLAQERAFFSEDGSTLIIPTDWEGARGNRIAVWNTSEWTRIGEFRGSNINNIIANVDGSAVMFNTDFREVVIWKPATDELSLLEDLAGISDYVEAFAFGSNHGLISLAADTLSDEDGFPVGTTRLYNTQARFTEYFLGADLQFRNYAMSSDMLVFEAVVDKFSDSGEKSVFGVDLSNPQRQLAIIDRSGPLALSRDGELAAMIHQQDTVIEIWSSDEAKLIARLDDSSQTHTSEIEIGNPFKHLSFSPDSRQLVSVDLDDIVRIWDLTTGNLAAINTSFGHLEPLGLRSETLYTKAENMIRKWPLTGAQPANFTYWNGVGLLSPDLQTAVVAVNPIDALLSARIVPDFPLQITLPIVPIQIWDLETMEVASEFNVAQENGLINELMFSPDGTWLLVSMMLDMNGVRDQASIQTLVFDLGLGADEAILYDEFTYNDTDIFVNFGFATNNEFVMGLDEFRDSENFETLPLPLNLINVETEQERSLIEDLKTYGYEFYPDLMAVNSSVTRLATVTNEEITLFDLEDGSIIKRVPLDFYVFTPSPSFNPAGDILLVGPITSLGETGESIWYSALTGEALSVPSLVQYLGIFSNDGTLYTFEDLTGRVQIWGVGAEYIEPAYAGFQIVNEPWIVYDFDASADVFSSEDGKLVRVYDELPRDEMVLNPSGGGGGDSSNNSGQSTTPTSAPAVQSCPSAPPPRLTVGELGIVSDTTPNNLRAEPTVSATLLDEIPSGAPFRVVGGPECSDGFAFWQVNYNAQIGWTAEGQGDIYWLSPYNPVTSQSSIPSCDGYLAPQLMIGQQARILPGDPNWLNTLPMRPSQHPESVRLVSIPSGASFTVLDGPLCGDGGIVWWLIEYNSAIGWTGEGQGNTYWAEPVN